MNIKITHSWLREYLETDAIPEEIQEYLSLCGPSIERIEKIKDDIVYDIEITSNRIDMASVIGIAKEAVAILPRFGKKAKLIGHNEIDPEGIIYEKDLLPIEITDPFNLCKRILGIVMEVDLPQDAPKYMKERLESCGIRSLNNLIDITNYVMLEIGHPTHVFDYDRIKTNTLVMRNAKQNEEMITLDNKKYSLLATDVVIDDGSGRVIDFPGIMGAQNSVVVSKTKRILFFIESNNPANIRKSSMTHGIRTLAATYNEKDPHPVTAMRAFLRGIKLYQEIAHAKIKSKIVDVYPKKSQEKENIVETTVPYIVSRLGVAIPNQEIADILNSLHIKTIIQNDQLVATIPLERTNDLIIPEDLIEEIARIWGYFNFPNNLSPSVYVKQPREMDLIFKYQHIIKIYLKHLGLYEVMNYSMISRELIEKSEYDIKGFLELANVMSEEIQFMRTSLLPSLLKNMKENTGRKEILRLFELAKIYPKQEKELPNERLMLGIATNTSYWDLKGIVEGLLNELHIESYEFQSIKHAQLSNGCELHINKKRIGFLGQIKHSIKDNFSLTKDAFVAQFDFQSLISCAKTLSRYSKLHPYAVIKLDMTIDQNPLKPYETLKMLAFQKSAFLQKLELLNIYKNKLTLRFYFSDPLQNMTEDEAKKELEIIKGIVN